ncbi:type VI secretion system membrane subunit TssM [Azospirillum picis]|uniref:Type VI secretion system protein ImpL n=1 Tax=Azospirillum picis TaxID=488438 RepID=A0ABU0MS99_9PROT|nr:type VI secretion system membrane subunit TssM [Azospirillum picis]MBP2301917.1 type VI secretion system protein ImpL [Azospirillum picis]MDQ0536366.1 type VI secretion system protein ImpL [Azospirillum picis]
MADTRKAAPARGTKPGRRKAAARSRSLPPALPPSLPPSLPSPHLGVLTRWAVSLGGALALGLIGWLLLPRLAAALLPPLLPLVAADWTLRLLPLLLALAGWVAVNRAIDRRGRAANARLVEALAAARDPELKASLEEIAAVRQRLDAALARLRGGGRYLYRLPWYLVIGAPGSGKTTALANSGLASLPGAGKSAATEAGGGPVRGLGGTRNCDWWFTDRAVLIDTAGRYTTQDSRRAVDGRVWSGLLDLLKEHRPRQPVNGVLLTLSLPDLAAWSAAERRDHAILVRRRLAELRTHLGVRLPVYLLLTKTDLVEGFATFFDPLDREGRRQVWGLTLPAAERAGGPLPDVRDLYAGLVRRLDERLLDRLHQEPDLRRRAAAFAFPQRIAALEPALADIVDTVFGSERGEEVLRLRGLYLTSATRTDGPLGLAEPAPDEPAPTHFLARLLPELVFPEANLVRVDEAVERRRRRRTALSGAAALAAGLLLGGWWLASARGNAALLERADAGAAAVEAALRPLDTPPLSLGRVESADAAAILPALDGLRRLAEDHGAPASWTSASWTSVAGASVSWANGGSGGWIDPALAGGLYQGGRIAGPALDAYRRALRTQFLARIALRLEDRLRADWALPDQLARTLAAYRMVGGTAPMDPAALAEWLALDWQRVLPGPGNEGRRRALGDHLAALFAVGFAPVPPDEALVARVGEVLAQSTPSQGRAAAP